MFDSFRALSIEPREDIHGFIDIHGTRDGLHITDQSTCARGVCGRVSKVIQSLIDGNGREDIIIRIILDHTTLTAKTRARLKIVRKTDRHTEKQHEERKK